MRRTCFVKFVTIETYDLEMVERVPSGLFHKYTRHYKGQITFEGNVAAEGGNVIYGGALQECRVDILALEVGMYTLWYYVLGLDALAVLTQLSVEELTRDPLNIASDAFKVCICSSQKPNCSQRSVSHTTYPGKTVSFPVVAVGQANGTVPGVILAKFSESEEAWLDQLQNTQPTNSYSCTLVEYTVSSTGTRPANLVLSAGGPCGEAGITLSIHFNFHKCPEGFTLTYFGSCECEKRLQKYTNSCDINYRTITCNGVFWIGFDSRSQGLILHPHCPFDYCKLETVSLMLNSTDVHCAHRRSGTLCGACRSGLSFNLGSSQCSPCSNLFLLLFLPFAIAGFLLVVFLFSCKVTVASGTTMQWAHLLC